MSRRRKGRVDWSPFRRRPGSAARSPDREDEPVLGGTDTPSRTGGPTPRSEFRTARTPLSHRAAVCPCSRVGPLTEGQSTPTRPTSLHRERVGLCTYLPRLRVIPYLLSDWPIGTRRSCGLSRGSALPVGDSALLSSGDFSSASSTTRPRTTAATPVGTGSPGPRRTTATYCYCSD